MAPNVGWDVSLSPNGTQTLNLWSTRLKNTEPAFQEMANALAAIQQDWWKSDGQGTWAPLKEPYRSWKRKRFPSRGILRGPDRPGHKGLQLERQLTRRPFGYERISNRELVIGSTLDYAIHHQKGTPNMVARPPLKPVDTITAQRLARILQTHISGQAGGF